MFASASKRAVVAMDISALARASMRQARRANVEGDDGVWGGGNMRDRVEYIATLRGGQSGRLAAASDPPPTSCPSCLLCSSTTLLSPLFPLSFIFIFKHR